MAFGSPNTPAPTIAVTLWKAACTYTSIHGNQQTLLEGQLGSGDCTYGDFNRDH